jgi:conserved oligomeric Golgi complex subunit 4
MALLPAVRHSHIIKPSGASPSPPVETLQQVREQLLAVFSREFNAAARAKDEAGISKFFKLFPLIGWEKEGLDAYAGFVVDIVRNRPIPTIKGLRFSSLDQALSLNICLASSPMYYITMLTALFEHVAHIVHKHQPVVEKHYGTGKMLPVILKLLNECASVIKRYIQGWEEERTIQRKVKRFTNSRKCQLTTSTAFRHHRKRRPDCSCKTGSIRPF